MEKDNINYTQLDNLSYDYNNIELLKVAKYLLGKVVNDIDIINKESYDIAEDYLIDYDMGCDTYIKKEDLESIYSILDTIHDIEEYNRKEEE